jgi:hypothetical protein
VLGYDALEVGLAFLPVAVAIGALSVGFSVRLVMRFGARETVLPGLVSIVLGLLFFTRVPVDADYVSSILPGMLLLGVGAGLSIPSLMTLAMSGVAPSDSGLASGLVNTTQQVGGALGLAVIATLSTTRTGGLLAAGASTASALTAGITSGSASAPVSWPSPSSRRRSCCARMATSLLKRDASKWDRPN